MRIDLQKYIFISSKSLQHLYPDSLIPDISGGFIVHGLDPASHLYLLELQEASGADSSDSTPGGYEEEEVVRFCVRVRLLWPLRYKFCVVKVKGDGAGKHEQVMYCQHTI